jgi:hypothetical protein
MDNAYKSSLPNSSGPFASETSTPARGYRAEERPRVRPVVRDESVVGIYSEHVNPQPGGFAIMEDGLRFTPVPGSSPSSVNSASGLDTPGWNFGPKRSLGSINAKLSF